jgi:biopolymer transport protein ExbD
MPILLRRRANQVDGASTAAESDVDITPMLDVVFILLVFFIVTASFVKETGIGINKPARDGISEPSAAPIIVEISSANLIRIQNIEVSAAAIRPTIVRLRAESPDAAVVVRLDPNARTQIMIAAVDSIRAANVEFPSVSLTSG